MKRTKAGAETASRTVTVERAMRLCKMLSLLDSRPQTRGALQQRLRIDVRGFYRDLEVLREAGIVVSIDDRRYRLLSPWSEALSRLPFPDPVITLGEAQVLSRGRSKPHKKLKKLIAQITSSGTVRGR